MRCGNQVQENRHYRGGRLGLSGVAHQSTAVNPTLTIVANSLRVADHLAERLGSPLHTREGRPAHHPDVQVSPV
jgi:hypothetical protein